MQGRALLVLKREQSLWSSSTWISISLVYLPTQRWFTPHLSPHPSVNIFLTDGHDRFGPQITSNVMQSNSSLASATCISTTFFTVTSKVFLVSTLSPDTHTLWRSQYSCESWQSTEDCWLGIGSLLLFENAEVCNPIPRAPFTLLSGWQIMSSPFGIVVQNYFLKQNFMEQK